MKHQRSTLLDISEEIYRWPMDFPHKWLVIQKALSCHKAIVTTKYFSRWNQHAFSYKKTCQSFIIFVTTIVLGISIVHRPVLCKRHSDDSWLTATLITGNDWIIDNLMHPIVANRSTVSWFLLLYSYCPYDRELSDKVTPSDCSQMRRAAWGHNFNFA